jgi:integrase
VLAEFHLNDFEAKPMNVKKTYEVILEECRGREDWKIFNSKNFHALRHTYATTLLASGVPVTDVSKVLGHAKVSTTYDVYSHAIPQNMNVISDKISLEFLK